MAKTKIRQKCANGFSIVHVQAVVCNTGIIVSKATVDVTITVRHLMLKEIVSFIVTLTV